MELKHVKTFEGSPRPDDVFQPHLLSVELLSDMDELFNMARRMAAGERPAQAGESPGEELAAGGAALGRRQVQIEDEAF